ncbi:MAG: hypothetical protein ISS93_00020 [Candidatus Aenigmarchaeota archaeon]|nr:hypothetical protein [Candidatus Aenigmarchaeota archaeon]
MVKYKKGKEPGAEIERRYKEEVIEDLYELEPRRQERAIFEEQPLPEERLVTDVKVRHRATPRMEERKIQPLTLLGEDVMGSLFDRVDFIGKRIEEISESIKLRDVIHKEMVEEINIDVKEKDAMASKVADIDEKRNFKLDISILRKEKRLENVQYWRDLVELRSELRELLEQYQTEKKIADIFRDISGGEAA